MIRIAITGPESSGKTTLARQLAERLNADFIPEFARQYLENKEGKYTQADLDEIAREHKESVSKSQKSIKIIDTDYFVLKVWSEYRFGNSTSYIDELIAEEVFDFHFVCKPNIPWEDDPLRENPHDRDELFDLYIQHLDHYQRPYEVIQGSVEERIEKCLKILNERLNLNY